MKAETAVMLPYATKAKAPQQSPEGRKDKEGSSLETLGGEQPFRPPEFSSYRPHL